MINISVTIYIIDFKATCLRRRMKPVIKTFEGGSYFRIDYTHVCKIASSLLLHMPTKNLLRKT